jgi:hypothetical protein
MKMVTGLSNKAPGRARRLALETPPNRTYWVSLVILGLPAVVGIPSLFDIVSGGSNIPASLSVVTSIDVGANLTASGALIASLYRWQIKPSLSRLTQWAKICGLTLIGNLSLLALVPLMNRLFPETIGMPMSLLMATTSATIAWIGGKRALLTPYMDQPLPNETLRPHRGYRLALRETGQLLMLCALHNALYGATAVVRQRRYMGMNFGAHGYVEYRCYDEPFTDASAERDMMVFLAGMSAERTMLGTVGQGGQGDMAKWNTTAKRYLSNGFKSPYFPHPTCDADARHNAIVLSKLLDTFQHRCDAFMHLNNQLLVQLAHVLLKRGELSLSDLFPLSTSIEFPDELHQMKVTSSIQSGQDFQQKGEAA